MDKPDEELVGELVVVIKPGDVLILLSGDEKRIWEITDDGSAIPLEPDAIRVGDEF